jgi:multifunctional methyltransferase subunit TRM112
MKLLTHNMLACHIKGVENGYPFRIEAEVVERHEQDFDPDFLRHLWPRVRYDALRAGAAALGVAEGLPEEVTSEMLAEGGADEALLRRLHTALLETHLEQGWLVCPETGRRFRVEAGIPNLLLEDDEV